MIDRNRTDRVTAGTSCCRRARPCLARSVRVGGRARPARVKWRPAPGSRGGVSCFLVGSGGAWEVESPFAGGLGPKNRTVLVSVHNAYGQNAEGAAGNRTTPAAAITPSAARPLDEGGRTHLLSGCIRGPITRSGLHRGRDENEMAMTRISGGGAVGRERSVLVRAAGEAPTSTDGRVQQGRRANTTQACHRWRV